MKILGNVAGYGRIIIGAGLLGLALNCASVSAAESEAVSGASTLDGGDIATKRERLRQLDAERQRLLDDIQTLGGEEPASSVSTQPLESDSTATSVVSNEVVTAETKLLDTVVVTATRGAQDIANVKKSPRKSA